jgi:hypothetical protein
MGSEVTSGCMALVTLGCRNGLALCGTVEMIRFVTELQVRWYDSASVSADSTALSAVSAAGAVMNMVGFEAVAKSPSASRGLLENALKGSYKACFASAGTGLSEQQAGVVLCDTVKVGLLHHDDTSLACGCCNIMMQIGYMHPGALVAADEAGLFDAGVVLHRRIDPSQLAEEWWVNTCGVIDVTSTNLNGLYLMCAIAKRLPSAIHASWWKEMLDNSMRMAKVNASAGLSGRDTMCFIPVVHGLGLIEAAVGDESKHKSLLEAGLLDALEYAILHDFVNLGVSVAANASGAAVALVGRNEGGKVLRREAVLAVLDRLWVCVGGSSAMFADIPAKSVMLHLGRIVTMSVSDANKKHMLQDDHLVEMLLYCLMLDKNDPRCGQDGADALQEASAGVLHELALYGPGAALLRSHADVVKTLHQLCEDGTTA